MPGSKEEEKVVGPGVTGNDDNDEFGAAFGEAADDSSSDDKAEALEKERAEEKEEKEEAKSEGEAEDKSSEDEKEPAKTDAGTSGEDWEQKYKSLQGVIEGLQGELDTLKSQKSDPEKKEGKEPEGKPQDGIDFEKMAEEDPEIRDFLDEYDYLAGPLQKLLKKVAPAKVDARTKDEDLAAILHVATITAAHPEYPSITKIDDKGLSPLKLFVGTYAGDDKDRVDNAYKKGDASEVIWLIDRYKDSIKKPTNGTNGTGKKKKLDDLTAVESKAAAINPNAKGSGGDTFEDGFEEAARRK